MARNSVKFGLRRWRSCAAAARIVREERSGTAPHGAPTQGRGGPFMADDLNDVTDESSESSEALIAVHWHDEGYYPPPAAFVAQANASDPAIREQFTEDKFPDSFTAYADLLTWSKPWDTVLDTSNAPFWKWFVGGELNASYNCVDRHLETHPNKAALIFVPEPEN